MVTKKKLLMKSAERSTKWCQSNDEETGDNAEQRLKVMSSTTEQKASLAPTVWYGSAKISKIRSTEKAYAQVEQYSTSVTGAMLMFKLSIMSTPAPVPSHSRPRRLRKQQQFTAFVFISIFISIFIYLFISQGAVLS